MACMEVAERLLVALEIWGLVMVEGEIKAGDMGVLVMALAEKRVN
jgi:hypothetical protein